MCNFLDTAQVTKPHHHVSTKLTVLWSNGCPEQPHPCHTQKWQQGCKCQPRCLGKILHKTTPLPQRYFENRHWQNNFAVLYFAKNKGENKLWLPANNAQDGVPATTTTAPTGTTTLQREFCSIGTTATKMHANARVLARVATDASLPLLAWSTWAKPTTATNWQLCATSETTLCVQTKRFRNW